MNMLREAIFSIGTDSVEIPFVWVPNGHGLRPGDPWFEAGRMSLGVDASPPGAEPDPSLRRHASATQDNRCAGVSSLPASWDGAPDGQGSPGQAQTSTRPRRYGDSDIVALGAAMQAMAALAQVDPEIPRFNVESQR
jgi:hypothetical protein